MRLAYIDCSAGAAGDMLLAALVDAGASEEDVRAALDSLGVDGWGLEFTETKKNGLRATRAVVNTLPGSPRNYREIVDLIERSTTGDIVRRRALETFERLGRAEARVHAVDPNDVRFHEVGSLDAIVDIVGCCAALESLHVDRVAVSRIATGTGTTRSAHGELPLPAPAVLEIFEGTEATLFGRGQHELVTPTGAALLATIAHEFSSLPAMRVKRTGYGAGTRDLDFPNVVRVAIGESVGAERQDVDEVLLVESNIDDMAPELFPHVVETLLVEGAQDAWVTPIVMKKGRPAFTLSILCRPEDEQRIIDILFRETTTLGCRTMPARKRALEREWITARVEGFPVRVKIGRSNGRATTMAPEHDDAVAAAKATGLPLKQIYARALEEVREPLQDGGG